jgi:glycosyltransferase involved in cell wall biosynthesis
MATPFAVEKNRTVSAPLVSVVVPVYNGAKYLRQALDSALGQTYQPLQVVVVDDGSSDGSWEVMLSYGGRVRSLRQDNAGVAEARNAGIQASYGELIAFLDQDDWWLPGKVEKQVASFRSEERVALVHTGVSQYSEADGALVSGIYDTSVSHLLQGNCYEQLLLGNGVYNSSVMIRRSVLTSAGMFDPRIPGNTVQDYDLWLRIARHNRLGYVPEPLTVLRLHNEQGTWNRRAMLTDELSLLERILGEEQLRGNRAMRVRVARLLDELGIAHLDAQAPRLARRCFGRALRNCWSQRAAVLFAVCCLPPPMITWLRRQWADRIRRAMG